MPIGLAKPADGMSAAKHIALPISSDDKAATKIDWVLHIRVRIRVDSCQCFVGGYRSVTASMQSAHYCVRRLRHLAGVFGSDEFGHADAEVFIQNQDFATGDQAAVDENVDRVAGEFVERDDGAL